MSKIPEFHFNFGAVMGMPFEEGAEVLFRQMEDHYNAHIQPKPYIFGADPGAPGGDKQVTTITRDNTILQQVEGDVVQMRDDFEIKPGTAVGVKDGYFLTGVTSEGVEVFDKIITPKDPPWPLIVEGESGKYNLGTDPNA